MCGPYGRSFQAEGAAEVLCLKKELCQEKMLVLGQPDTHIDIDIDADVSFREVTPSQNLSTPICRIMRVD